MKLILERILEAKKKELKERARLLPPRKLAQRVKKITAPPRDFLNSIRIPNTVALIAELKKASPAKGCLREKFDLAGTARLFEECGAAALSVLTDRHFQGSLADLETVKPAVRIPVLRKDFILNEYQVYESRLAGADALLLIAGALSRAKLNVLLKTARALKLTALVEVHDENDIAKIRGLPVECVGINNRDLCTFKTDIGTTERLFAKIKHIPVIVSESGIRGAADVIRMKKTGVHAVLVGEGIVTAANMRRKIKSLVRHARKS